MSASIAPWHEVALSDVCEFKYGKNLPEDSRAGGVVPVFGSNGVVGSHDEALTAGPTIVIGRKGSFGEVNYSPTPCWPIDTTYYVDGTATDVNLRWLMHRLRALGLNKMNRAAAVPGLNREDAYRQRLLLPPASKQQQLADILDKADALRAKRRAALAQLDTLTQCIFLDMFGDPATNPKRWPFGPLSENLAAPLRNGLSPSRAGNVTAKVLTLSAVTGPEFDPQCWKVSTFRAPPPLDQSVREEDFLICRGNGNLRLVGRGFFPTSRMADVTFPDTMIAARLSPERLDRAFLQHVWNSTAVRRQIESVARTTNGTFKVNQTMLENVGLVTPPLPLQRDFARCIAAVAKLKNAHITSLTELNALFASLQHRAFRGEL